MQFSVIGVLIRAYHKVPSTTPLLPHLPLAGNPVTLSLCTPFSTPRPANLGIQPERSTNLQFSSSPLCKPHSSSSRSLTYDSHPPAARHSITVSHHISSLLELNHRATSTSYELPSIPPSSCLRNSCLTHPADTTRHKGTAPRPPPSFERTCAGPPPCNFISPRPAQLRCAHNRIVSPIP